MPARKPAAKRPAPARVTAARRQLRIATWNINSVRIRLEPVAQFLEQWQPDVLCLQETKTQDMHFPAEAFAGLGYGEQAIRGQKSYNGVAILAKVPLAGVGSRGWCGKEDCRHVVAELPGAIELHNFYVPAGGDIPDPAENPKFAHKLQFLRDMTDWFATMPGQGKARRVLVGDLNVAPLETDVWSHKALLKVVSHTPIEVELMDKLKASHRWVDAVRHFIPPEEKLYSWWSYRSPDWAAADKGRRLDHIWVTPALSANLRAAEVAKPVRGWQAASDHAPVLVTLDVP